jgi:hypothetical protein
MLKKVLLVAAATLAFGLVAKAQTNLQMFYDFGKDRQFVTTTLEGFYNDNWGNTFFFIDHDFDFKGNGGVKAPAGTYMEFARCLNFWQDVPVLGNFSLQLEYNGGIYKDYFIQSALLVGVDYFLHSANFNNTFNFKVLYKKIASTVQQVPLQFTFVWGMQDLFGLKGLRFSGFADFWWEDHTLFLTKSGANSKLSHIVFISEPQLWYNVGQWIGVDNFNLGGEVELSYDFGSSEGFWVRPCLGAKWVF